MANDGVLSIFTKDWLGHNYTVAGIITILVVFLQAVLVNNLVNQQRLFKEITLFPGLFYILLVSAIQDFLPLSSVLLGNTFLILALNNLLATYKNPKCADAIFNVGFWVGTAALFYNAFVFFLLLAFLGLLILRNFKFKEGLMMVGGYLLPFMFASTYSFWYDQLGEYWDTYFLNQFAFLDFRLADNWDTNYKLILLVLFFLLGAFNRYQFPKSYKNRNYVNIIYTTLLISGLTFLFQNNIQISHFLIIATPLSILLAAQFLAFSKTSAELVHFALFVAVILFQFDVFL